MKLDTSPIFYVYEWYNVENGHVFYVGKGKGNRYNRISPTCRNRFFNRYVKKYQCNVRKIAENLTEEEAFELEKQTIVKYKALGECECNFDEGGHPGGSCRGELNGMYGKTHTLKVRELLRQVNSDGRHVGENNTQYGVPLRSRFKTEEAWQHWIKAHQEKFSGAGNPKARTVLMKRETGELYKSFECIQDCARYLLEIFPEFRNRKFDNFRRFPEVHCSPNHAYKGFYFEIIKPNKTMPCQALKEEGVTTIESVSIEKSNRE